MKYINYFKKINEMGHSPKMNEGNEKKTNALQKPINW